MSIEVQRIRPGGWARKLKASFNLPGLLFTLGLAAVWQLIVATGMVKLMFLPAPLDVIAAWWNLLISGQMGKDVAHTLWVAVLGFIIGSVVGLLVGVWLGISVKSWKFGMATIDFLRSIPAITFLSVATLILGLSSQMELTVTAYAALWLVLINTVEGLRRVELHYLDAAKTFQLSRIRTVFTVMLPSAAGSIIVGLRLGLALSLTLAVASEMIGNPEGMGYQLVMQQQALQPASMYAYIITIGVLGLLLNQVFIVVIRFFNPGIVAALREDAS